MNIKLTKGFSVMVDDCDYLSLSGFRWRALILKHTTYAVRGRKVSEGGPGIVYMHREILGCLPKQFADHINGNGLDNRRANLRIATRSQNQRNMKLYSDSTTRLKGVDYLRKKFRARIVIDGKQIHLGVFETPEAAHAVYCAAATKHFAQFARFN